MRVISGSARGHRLATLEGLETRPTTDRIKESLFNIMAPDLIDSEFLDLYSGSGGIGIEALSRGAKSAVFVENSRECCEIIYKNLEHTKLIHKSEIIMKDVLDTIVDLGKQGKKFDIIFIDPPYEGGYNESVLNAIVKSEILDENGYIILERALKYNSPQVMGLTKIKEKQYGKTTAMSFFALED